MEFLHPDLKKKTDTGSDTGSFMHLFINSYIFGQVNNWESYKTKGKCLVFW